jgi:hypothetical protein
MLEICTLRPSFLHKFTLIWHHAFAPSAQLATFLPDLDALYAMHPTFMKSTTFMKYTPRVDFIQQFMPYA